MCDVIEASVDMFAAMRPTKVSTTIMSLLSVATWKLGEQIYGLDVNENSELLIRVRDEALQQMTESINEALIGKG